jgi:hypothetical protein
MSIIDVRGRQLPEGWNAIEVERLWVRGKPTSLSARHGQFATLTSLEGE